MENQENMTRTTNGAVAYAPSHFLESEQGALTALNNVIVTKENFEQARPYLDKIFQGDSKIAKVYAAILIMYTRDIEFGKGLRKPFLEGMNYLYENGLTEFVCEVIPEIPELGYYKDLCNLFMLANEKKFVDLKTATINTFIEGLQYEYNKKTCYGLKNCGKFAPRQQKKYHKMAVELAYTMFPDNKQCMKEYRKYVSTIMKKYSQITEVLMSAKKWDEIDPKFVPSLCFQKYKKVFLKDQQEDEKKQKLRENYEKHINKALNNEDGAKINAKRITVDTIVEQFRSQKDELQLKALEAQFLDIVNDLKKNAALLKECICVCDVSGSMYGNPINACVGLGIAINEINQGKFSNTILTFSENPMWVNLGAAQTFKEKIEALMRSQIGMSTNFFATMQLISKMTKKREELPKALFVFSDMQFNSATCDYYSTTQNTCWNTTMENIIGCFKEQGFTEEDVPTIIFWNLAAGTKNFTVDYSQKKVIQIAGYSQNLVKAIAQAPDMDYILNLTPFTFLLETLDNKRYKKIKEIAMKTIA